MVIDKELALKIKGIVDQIRDVIPSQYADFVYIHWRNLHAPNAGRPCTCDPKQWKQMLELLRQDVADTLEGPQGETAPETQTQSAPVEEPIGSGVTKATRTRKK